MSLLIAMVSGMLIGVAPGASTQGAAAGVSLASLTGRWTCQGRFEASGKPIASNLAFEWEPSSAALLVHHQDVAGGTYSSVELWAPAAGKLGWRAVIADAYSGMRRFSSQGWQGDTVAWMRDDAGAPPERFTYTLKPDDMLDVTWEIGKTVDTMRLGDRLRCTRVAST